MFSVCPWVRQAYSLVAAGIDISVGTAEAAINGSELQTAISGESVMGNDLGRIVINA